MKAEHGISNFALGWYFAFKMVPVVVAGFCIYLGYRLFVLGVTGQASLVVNAKDISGQLINGAPGLFFAVGGVVALIFSIVKGVNVDFGKGGGGMSVGPNRM